jgi:hypothetical protein
VKGIDPSAIHGVIEALRDPRVVEDEMRRALSDVSRADVRWSAATGGVRLDVDAAVDPRGASPLTAALFGLGSVDDGVSLAVLARRCPVDATLVMAARGPARPDGVPVAPIAFALEGLARGLGDETFTKALRGAWAAAGSSVVSCQAWAADGKTKTLNLVGLRDTKAAVRALRAVHRVHATTDQVDVQLRPAGTGLALEMRNAKGAMSVGLDVVGDELVFVLGGDAEKLLATLRHAPLVDPPLLAGLEPAPLMAGIAIAKALRAPGEAVLRARLAPRADGRAEATVWLSDGAVRFVSDLGRALAPAR